MTASGHSELPGEQGNAHAVDETGSGQKITTGHVDRSQEDGDQEEDRIRRSRPLDRDR